MTDKYILYQDIMLRITKGKTILERLGSARFFIDQIFSCFSLINLLRTEKSVGNFDL